MTHPILKAGAGRAEIEFQPSIFPLESFEGMLDQPQVRVLLLEASQKLAIVSVDITSIPSEIVCDFKKITHQACGVPEENILICATHTFSMPHFKPAHLCKSPEDKRQNEILFNLYKAAIEKATIIALTEMKEAHFGYETGTCDINVNRDIRTKDGWWLGSNETGPADKTVTVLRFNDLNGNPISILYNYAVQPSVLDGSITSTGARSLSTDLAGAASHFVEEEYQGKPPAIFCIGAAGDQAPALKSKSNFLDKDGHLKPLDLSENGIAFVKGLGNRLGAEVVRVAAEIQCGPLTSPITYDKLNVNCPGQHIPMDIHSIKPTNCYEFVPEGNREEQVEIITIGGVAMVCVRPELTYQTAKEIKTQSPYTLTMVLTMVNGGAKYMADQSAYDHCTYEAMNSAFGRGSAEILMEQVVHFLNHK